MGRFLEVIGFLIAFPIMYVIFQSLGTSGDKFYNGDIPKYQIVLYLYFGFLQPFILQLLITALSYCWWLPEAKVNICSFSLYDVNSWRSLKMAEALFYSEDCYRVERTSFDVCLLSCFCFSAVRNFCRLRKFSRNLSLLEKDDEEKQSF